MTELNIDIATKGLAAVVHSTTASLTFVNFKEKKWVTTWPTVEDRLLLDMCDYKVIDDPIADAIMRINSLEDTSTTCCCAGHTDYPQGGYIWFNTMSAQLVTIMDRLKYWKKDGIDTYRIRNVGKDLSLWFEALKELYDAFKDFPNKFEQCHALNTGKTTRIVSHKLFRDIEEIDESLDLPFYEVDRNTLTFEQREVLKKYDESLPSITVEK